MSFRGQIKHLLQRAGIAVGRYPNSRDAECVRQQLLTHLGVDLVLDVGANTGQYGLELIRSGYRGRLVSFEPVRAFFDQLQAESAQYPRWECRPLALGTHDESAQINVAGTMSSMLTKAAGASDTVSFASGATEQINVARLDTLRPKLFDSAKRVWLKLDVQGFEMQALEGAAESLGSLAAIELELSLWAFYSGQTFYRDMIAYLEARHFTLWSLSPGLRDPSGRLIEMDGIFVRHEDSVAAAVV
jgi:FkbM family methyltransferase